MQIRKWIARASLGCLAVLALQAARIPSGTQVSVRLGQTISSGTAHSGDTFAATLASNVLVDGKVVAHRGDPVQGRVVEAKSSGRLSSPGVLKLQIASINGQPVNAGTVSREGGSHKGRNVKAGGGTAAVGAIIGAIAGGGRGAAIGAGAGAAAGTAGAAATGKKDVKYPSETVLRFTIR